MSNRRLRRWPWGIRRRGVDGRYGMQPMRLSGLAKHGLHILAAPQGSRVDFQHGVPQAGGAGGDAGRLAHANGPAQYQCVAQRIVV